MWNAYNVTKCVDTLMVDQDKSGAVERWMVRVVWGGTPRISYVLTPESFRFFINNQLESGEGRKFPVFGNPWWEVTSLIKRKRQTLATRARHEFIHLLNFWTSGHAVFGNFLGEVKYPQGGAVTWIYGVPRQVGRNCSYFLRTGGGWNISKSRSTQLSH